jgi:hypothetical protein
MWATVQHTLQTTPDLPLLALEVHRLACIALSLSLHVDSPSDPFIPCPVAFSYFQMFPSKPFDVPYYICLYMQILPCVCERES